MKLADSLKNTAAAATTKDNKKNKRKKKKRQKAKQQRQEQRMLFQKGIAIDDQIDDDLYSMLVPGEQDQNIKPASSASRGQKEASKKPNNIRSPFQENYPYDNIYQF